MNNVRVYLIDDKEDDRDIFCYALKAVDPAIQFDYAVSGRDGLNRLKQMPTLPHFIFIDLNMPGMTGLECLEAIKKVPRLKDVPVVIYSGVSNRKYEVRAKELQAAHYLVKPFVTEELTAVLKELLSMQGLPFLLPVNAYV